MIRASVVLLLIGIAKMQGWLHIIGAIDAERKAGHRAILGSLIVIAAVLLFAVIVFRTSKA